MEFVRTVQAGDLADGEGRTLEAGGRWIGLFRIGGAYFAVDNACPHMAGPLGAGRLDGYEVICPLHYWRIDLRTGQSPVNAHVRVARFDTRVEDGWVWVRCGAASSE